MSERCPHHQALYGGRLQRCTLAPAPGQKWCPLHLAAHQAEVEERRERFAPKPPPPVDLSRVTVDAEAIRSEFGRHLAAARRKRGYSQAQLAQRLGHKSDSTLGSWEYGRTMPSLISLIALMTALDCTFSALTGRDF